MPRDNSNSFAASSAQRRLWALQHRYPDSRAYTVTEAISLAGRIDAAWMEQALAALVERHAQLRAVFDLDSAGLTQRVLPPAAHPVRLAVHQCDRGAVRAWLDGELAQPFDLAGGPLYRASLLMLGEREALLVLSIHHIVTDGWSSGLLFAELGQAYGAIARGARPRWDSVPGDYRDAVARESARLASRAFAAELDQAAALLAGASPVLDLPFAGVRLEQATPASTERMPLAPALVARVEQQARHHGATPFVLYATAYAVLLARFTGQEEVVFGVPVAGRAHEQDAHTYGLFVNTVPVRVRVDPADTWSALVGRVRDQAFDACALDVPLDALGERLGGFPLQSMLVVQPGPCPLPHIEGVRAAWHFVEHSHAKFDLTLQIDAALAAGADGAAAGVYAALEYRADTVPQALARRMLAHWHMLLTALLEAPARAWSALLPATQAEQAVLASLRLAQRMPAPLDPVAAFAAQARAQPDAPALHAERTLSYAELAGRIAAIRAGLQAAGVGPGDFVGVCLRRQSDLVASLFAVLACGAAYVPFDPAYPPGRLGFIAEDARCALILVEPATRGVLAPGVASLLDLAALAPPQPGACPAWPAAPPESTAYLIYTSGSTGRPKGVAIPHRALRAFLGWAAGAFGAQHLSMVLASTSVCFDLSVFEIFLPLARGGTVRLVNTVLDLVEQAAPVPTLINTVPSAMTELLRAGALAGQVRVVNLAGEALARTLVEAIHAAAPAVRVFNLYGPSEDTTYSTWCEVARGATDEPAIGAPIDGTSAYVLDSRLLPAPLGADGELYLGGAGVALGYLGRPALSAERFLPDPFLAGGRMYRTGDRVRVSEQGQLRYLGRFDHQVKLRGFRIETAEIESRARAVAGVEQALVLVRTVGGAEHLVAYWTGAAGEEAVRAALADELPAFMVPHYLVRLAQFPLNANGKIERALLPAPATGAAAPGQDGAGAASASESALAALMAQVLKVGPLGADADFVALGGHSLLAMQLLVGVRERLQVRLRLSDIFKHRTVRALAALADELRMQEPDVAPLVASADQGAAPLSFAQERMWLLQRMRPDSSMLNIGAAVRLDGALDTEALRRALQWLTERHEALRLRVDSGADGVPRQRAVAGQAAWLQESGIDSLQACAPVLRGLLESPFDLACEAPARWVLLRAPEAAVLGLVIHHLVADAWSIELLFDQLFEAYNAVRAGNAPAPAPALSTRDYARWQRTHLDRPALLAPDLDYWRGHLAGLPPRLQLAWDHAPAQASSYRGERLRRRLDGQALAALLALARPLGATPFVALLSVYQALLARLSRQDEVLVGTPIANRDVAGAGEVVGCLLNTLVLRAGFAADPCFEQLLLRTRQDSLAAFDHQRAPFELVIAALDVERSVNHTPLIQTMFVLNDTVRARSLPTGLRCASVDVPPLATQYDVTLMIGRDDDGWHAAWDYRSDLFEPATIGAMADCYEALLAQAPGQARTPLSRLALGAAPPVAHGAAPLPATLPALFAAQAAAWPDAPAVRDDNGVLSYRELDLASERMARALVGAGVALEDRVALLLPKSCAAIVALLAVSKAGAAFLCLDPFLPDERLRALAADAGVRLHITDGAQAARLGLAPHACLLADAIPEADPGVALPGARLSAEHLAYIIYTSGSTGAPKGVMLSHRGLAQLQALHRDSFGAGPGAHVLQYAPVSFDASVWDVAMALLSGACLHLTAAAHALLPGTALAATLAERAITHLTLPPSNLALLAPAAGTLRCVVLAGEALPAELAQRWRSCVRLWNGYGPTEASVCATVHDCADTAPGRAPEIGRALSGTRAYVLDAGLNALPVGVPGELYLGGQGVARGYLNRPGMTAAAFLPDPFSQEPGARMYRSGDLARWSGDGRLDYLGRIDEQVKLRGIRIEPGEIERVLAGLDARIADAAVLLERGASDQYLVGFVTGAQRFDPQPLLAGLAARLPAYMVPAWLQFVERFPLTRNGKLDRKALAALAAPPHADGAAAAPPRGALEQEVAALWREVLGAEVGRSVSFFAAGGTSLSMTRLFDRIDQRYRGALKLVDLFQLNTVAAIAAALEHAGAGRPAAADFSFRL
ncbi:non-ribosomal peptide synthetase [Massilia aquatica]|uniref:Amino acid adenylation domain-containing protein n=1 Tax=Massilia aquatica TaxID=2609000 RepID=A0ABX0MBX2_9BURK|nr:non-ribosomal peptide synthetase [Massilia aquatica]NHZ41747.1 amino acid adenylation domain-containing protein [Massilia aquatica]